MEVFREKEKWKFLFNWKDILIDSMGKFEVIIKGSKLKGK